MKTRTMNKKILVVGTIFTCVVMLLSQDDSALRQSIDARLAPRALLLTGGALDSRSGLYMIEFPTPNQCVTLGPIAAQSRAFALYQAVSAGGFQLKPSTGGGLTVWTIEEWSAMEKEPWYRDVAVARARECQKGKP